MFRPWVTRLPARPDAVQSPRKTRRPSGGRAPDDHERCGTRSAFGLTIRTVGAREVPGKVEIKERMERAAGIEPASLAWKARVLPLHNARAVIRSVFHGAFEVKCNVFGPNARHRRQPPEPQAGSPVPRHEGGQRTMQPIAGYGRAAALHRDCIGPQRPGTSRTILYVMR